MITQEEIPYNRNEIEAMVKTIENLRKEKSEFIDKACEWIKQTAYFFVDDLTGTLDTEGLIKDFKKTMEE